MVPYAKTGISGFSGRNVPRAQHRGDMQEAREALVKAYSNKNAA
jgi:hypothetical protein